LKGIVFTLDALFALIVAVMAITILIYFQFYSQSPAQIKYSEAEIKLHELLSTNISSVTDASGIAALIAAQDYNSTWPTPAGNIYGEMLSQGHGPAEPFISLMEYHHACSIATHTLIGYGMAYFGCGNAVYAIDAITGRAKWTVNTIAQPSRMALYGYSLIYYNGTNITAVSAYDGSRIWSEPAFGSVSTGLVPYGSKIVYGTANAMIMLWASNGTLAWKGNVIGGVSQIAATGTGTLEVVTPSGISTYTTVFSNATQVCSGATLPTTNIAAEKSVDVVAFGDASTAYGYTAGCGIAFQAILSGTITGVAATANGTLIFQTANSMYALSDYGTTLWSKSINSSFGTGTASPPMVGENTVYSFWSNGYVIAQNSGTGNVEWYTQIPYIGSTAYGSLAYGRMYVSSRGSASPITVYGPCMSHGSSSILDAAAGLYLNGHGSCATYLLDSLYPMSNYTIYYNNKALPGADVVNLTGTGYITAAGSPGEYTDTYSISLWFKPTAWVGNGAGIFAQNGVSAGYPYIIEEGSASSPYVEFSVNGGGQGYTVYANITVGKWNNIVATYDYADGSTNIYLDGRLANSTSGTSLVTRDFSPIYLGYSPSSGGFAKGLIADVQMYGTNLSKSNVSQIYLNGIQGPTLEGNRLEAWYPLDGDTNDYGGGFHTAYPVNTIAYAYANFTPLGLGNAYLVTRAAAPVFIEDYQTGMFSIYNISVVAWR
jgi:hypothetical protein